MHSDKSRCIYQNNQLADVICQLRFPEILRIGTQVPADFQEAIRSDYPIYSLREETHPPRLTGTPENFHVEKGGTTKNHQFTSADGIWRVNLTSNFISLSCARYHRWEAFAAKLDKPLVAFIQTYQPAFFTRIGLRYMNFISRSSLDLDGTPFYDLIQDAYLGILGNGLIPEHTANRSTVDAEYRLADGCHVKLHAGLGMVKQNGKDDPETKFILDQDLFFMQTCPVQEVADTIQSLHTHAYPIFRNAITDLLHNAMQPE
ncbi:MAG: TIGR04255 family protein [Oscillospiraceae bacterium]|nr:TIGR04255 family protein [Oscillospiraceae bacterium]